MESVISRIKEYKTKIDGIKVDNKRDITREQFTFLLSAPASFRIVPGIQKHLGFNELYVAETAEQAMIIREFFKNMFHIEDKPSLIKALEAQFRNGVEYGQFMTFWVKAPLFDVEALNEGSRKAFETKKANAELFRDIVEERGFYAWDINEKIGLCRNAVAAGIISKEEFWEVTDEWVKQAMVFYKSFEEYAISCLCGAAYFMYRGDVEATHKFLDINFQLLDQLIGDDKLWTTSNWYTPEKREYANLISPNPGCVITKAALESEKIGYMFRGIPAEGKPDSGWRFFLGNESKEYTDNADNLAIVGLNTICNIDPTIIAYIDARVGKGYHNLNGKWIDEEA